MAHGWPTTSALDQFKLKAKREKWDEESCTFVCTFHSWGRSDSLNHRKQVEKMWMETVRFPYFVPRPVLFKIIFWKLYTFKKRCIRNDVPWKIYLVGISRAACAQSPSNLKNFTIWLQRFCKGLKINKVRLGLFEKYRGRLYKWNALMKCCAQEYIWNLKVEKVYR